MPASRDVPPDQRALLVAVFFSAVPALVAGLALGLGIGWIYGLVGFVVVGTVLGLWALRAGDRAALSGLSWTPADQVAHARYCNLVEGLCTAAGVRQPRLAVVDSPALNAMAAGTAQRRSVVAVTSGLLAELERVELEGVLAELIYLVRHDEIRPETVLVATFGIGRTLALPADRDSAADQGAISLTRYPPALAAALEKVQNKGAEVAGVAARCAHLWLAEPRPTEPARRGRLPLHDRIEALREL